MFAKLYSETEALPESPALPSGRSAQRVMGRSAAGVDALLVVSAFFLAYGLRQGLMDRLPPLAWGWDEKLGLIGLMTLGWVLFGFVLRLYDGAKRSLSQEVLGLAGVAFLTGLTVGAAAFLFHLDFLSRPVVVVSVTLAFAEATTFRMLARGALERSGVWTRKVIVVGSGPSAVAICERVSRSGAELVGVIPEDPTGSVPRGIRHLGALEDAEAIFRRQVVDEVIFSVPRTKLAEVELAITIAEELGLETKLSLDFLPHRFSRIKYEELGDTPLLSFQSAPAHPVQLGLKRLFDIGVSASALILGAPVFLTVAALVKLSSKGPVFFGQRRSGLNGREFTAWKFRSMVVDAEAKLGELLAQNEMSGPVFKMSKDPRVTPIGRFLRKTSLDELPQFWNVLVGEMSIVGPRPPIPAEVAKYNRQQRRRLSVKPGITCIWQVSGRNQVDFGRWMEMDLEYIDNWSLWLDLKLFLQTVPAVVFTRGAH